MKYFELKKMFLPWMIKVIHVLEESSLNDIWSQGKLICRETQGGWDDQPGGQKTERGRTIQIWKILTGQDDVPENHWFNRVEPDPTRETRLSSNNLNLKRRDFNSDVRRNSFIVRAPDIWNTIPEDVRDSKTLNSFKNKYDEYVKQQ